MKNDTLFNILIRTSNRPNYFKKCIESIRRQTYKNYNIIVSVDDDFTWNYVKEYDDITIVRVKYIHPTDIINVPPKRRPAPWNLYLNELLKYTKNGYVLYIDDDDMFNLDNSLLKLNTLITSVNNFVMWQVLFPNNIKIPNDVNFLKYKHGHPPISAQVSILGFCHSTIYNDSIEWTPYSFGDFRVATKLYEISMIKLFINDSLTTLQRTSANGMGKRDDLPNE